MSFYRIYGTAVFLLIAALIWQGVSVKQQSRPTAGKDCVSTDTLTYCLVRDDSGRLTAIRINTMSLRPLIYGYGGPIDMTVILDPDGTIENITVNAHQETPGYADRLPVFVQQFINRPGRRSYELEEDVDGISGATITSEAVVTSINRILNETPPVQSRKMNTQHSSPLSPKTAPFTAESFLWIGLTALLIILAVSAVHTGSRTLHWVTMAAAFFLFGLYGRIMLSVTHIANTAAGHFPHFYQAPAWTLLALSALLLALWQGRTFCASLCPFAFVEEALTWLRKRIFPRRIRVPAGIDRRARWIKYLFLIAILAACLIWNDPSIAAVEVYLLLFSRTASIAGWALIIVILSASLLYFRFWCRYLCPTGAFLALLSRWSKSSPVKQCADGNRSYEQICLTENGAVDPAECFNCGKCARVETKTARGYRSPLFITILGLTICLFISVMAGRISFNKGTQPPQDMDGVEVVSPREDIDKIRKNLKRSGITPRPAEYWVPYHESDH